MAAVDDVITQAFISENPFEIVMRRRDKLPQEDGGFLWGPEQPKPAQTCRLVQSGRVGAAGQRHTPDGRLREVVATLVFMAGADVQIGDLCNIPDDVAAGDHGLIGEWIVMDISGRWAVNAEIAKHAS